MVSSLVQRIAKAVEPDAVAVYKQESEANILKMRGRITKEFDKLDIMQNAGSRAKFLGFCPVRDPYTEEEWTDGTWGLFEVRLTELGGLRLAVQVKLQLAENLSVRIYKERGWFSHEYSVCNLADLARIPKVRRALAKASKSS